ncbi:MAG: tetratricopeptide repeat protein, partial [Natronospirillum sp.]
MTQAKFTATAMPEAAQAEDQNSTIALENQAAWHLDRAGVNGISTQEHRYHLAQVNALGEALLAFPSARPKAHNLLGRAALEVGRYEDAERHLAAAVKEAPEDPGIRFSLGHLALQRQ